MELNSKAVDAAQLSLEQASVLTVIGEHPAARVKYLEAAVKMAIAHGAAFAVIEDVLAICEQLAVVIEGDEDAPRIIAMMAEHGGASGYVKAFADRINRLIESLESPALESRI